MTVIQLESVRERSQHRRHRSRHGEPAAQAQQHPAVSPAQPVEQVRPKESVAQEFVGQDRFGSRDGSQLNPKTLREFVGQDRFGSRDGSQLNPKTLREFVGQDRFGSRDGSQLNPKTLREFVGQDRFGSRDGSQLNPKTLREFVGQDRFGSRGGVSTAQPREQARSPSSPGLAMRHPEAVYRRRRLVLVSVIGAVLTILLAVGRPETLPGHEFPAQQQPIWPAVQLHDLSVHTGAPEASLWGTAVEVGTGRGP